MYTLLITGANKGIGLEFVKQYLEKGWNVISTCRNPEEAYELKALKEKYCPFLEVMPLDVSDLKSIEELSRRLKDVPIDLLISNAGSHGSRNNSFGDIDYENWIETFIVNAVAGMKISESFIDQVSCSQIRKIVFLTSKMGSIADNGSGGSYIYRSTKSALNAIVKSLSIDLKNRGISVILFHPGWVLTDMGGPNALITPSESVNGMIHVIDSIKLDSRDVFFDYRGNVVPW